MNSSIRQQLDTYGEALADSYASHVVTSFASRLENLLCLMLGGDSPTPNPSSQSDEWVDVDSVTPEEWLAWTGLTQYSGLFAQARVHQGQVYLHSYSGHWFQLAGVRVTDEILIDHAPRLHQLSPT